MIYRVRFGSEIDDPSDTICVNDRSDVDDLWDDHELISKLEINKFIPCGVDHGYVMSPTMCILGRR